MKNPNYHPDKAHLPSDQDMINYRKNRKEIQAKEARRLRGEAHLKKFFTQTAEFTAQ
jgi:hypothetical protein